MNKNVILKIIGIVVVILMIPLFLLSAFALQGLSTLPDLSARASLFYEYLYIIGAAVNIISVPLMLTGYIKNYKFNWINYSLFAPIVLNGFITFSILAGIVRGDFEIGILLVLPSIVYLVAWTVYKNR